MSVYLLSCATNTSGRNAVSGKSPHYRKDGIYLDENRNWHQIIQERNDIAAGNGLPHWVWNNIPSTNTPVFLGVSSPYVQPDMELSSAKAYAAGQAIRYLELTGFTQAVSVYTHLGEYFTQEIKVHCNTENTDALIEEMEIIAEYRNNTGTYILAMFPGKVPELHFPVIPEDYHIELKTRTPDIPGYYVAVGASRQFLRISDSMRKADENCLAELLKQQRVHIVTEQEYRDVQGSRIYLNRDKYEYSTGIIQGFYILARWKDGDHFFSLGIAPK